jgi:hypothetical protein
MMTETSIQNAAQATAAQLAPTAATSSDGWQRHWTTLQSATDDLLKLVAAAPDAKNAPVETPLAKDAWNWLKENPRTIRNAVIQVDDNIKNLGELPRVQADASGSVPRVVALGNAMLTALENQWSEQNFAVYLSSFQQVRPLQSNEVWAVPAALKMSILTTLVPAAQRLLQANASQQDTESIPRLMSALQALGVTAFPRLLEPLLPVESILRQDPIYARMDAPSRDRYRNAVAHLAKRADLDELNIAMAAIQLANAASQVASEPDLRIASRRSHVGYYLVAEGRAQLLRTIGYNPALDERLRTFLQAHATDFYISGIWILTLLLITLLMIPVLRYTDVLVGLAIAFLLTILPASQAAVETMNHIVAAMFPAIGLPKLDFSKGIPAEHATLVTVPTLLLNEAQTRQLVDDLEVRYLANKDANLHFALVTDLPDSAAEPAEHDSSDLVNLAADLIAGLNESYAGDGGGSFFLLHRHRIFNARQGVWMGWERKRGKLLDLNRLLRSEYDSFPIKRGPLELLPGIRYVLTLDSDTDLPRGSAAQLVATMAHPLNQAIVDPNLRIVTQGYGILQPRVGISVHSAAQSRLARLYSGETGLDIYSRAVSDVYQDLFHDAIFTGKGLYEVDTLRHVLEHRFPHNALLSHDLIEGAYARVGLVSDVEVIDDYPSHLSAWSRRKHRWVRGDWQVTQWLFPKVPDESNHRVPNPISVLSRWKIFDNLRRSLVEPATFFLLAGGWLRLPGGPLYWTLATLAVLFLPIYIQLAASLFRAALRPVPGAVIDALEGFFASHVTVLLAIAFLPHQTLLSLDAILRTMVRRFTGKRLLEWETAAEAEQGKHKRTPVELYLELMPAISLALAGLIALVNVHALPFALPFLVLWAADRPITQWLNRPPQHTGPALDREDAAYLRRVALLTWRYFAEFSTAEHHWLIPDNVEENGMHVAARVSPTNLGLLLNSRQVALRLGFLTLPKFVQLTGETINSLERMEKYRGHLLNWYDTPTMQPLSPRIVSSVDNGNLLASLFTLAHGCNTLLHDPLLPDVLRQGLLDLQFEAEIGEQVRKDRARAPQPAPAIAADWVATLLALPDSAADGAAHPNWFALQLAEQKASVRALVTNFTPWLLPDFAYLVRTVYPHALAPEALTLAALPGTIAELDLRLQQAWNSQQSGQHSTLQIEPLRLQLAAALKHATQMTDALVDLSHRALALAEAMDFSILLHPTRKLLSIAYNVDKDRIEEACYDLLASEARTAVFLAIAKDEIPQDAWFQLGRSHIFDHDRPLLVSWTGTMFEYLMPSLWMEASQDSMLDRTQQAAVRAQRLHIWRSRLPWGISEAGYATPGEDGHYQYHAFGIPALAVSPSASDGGPVIAPYATCLALTVDPRASLQNLHRMMAMGWLTGRGFYESADYSNAAVNGRKPVLVRSWMAHHQGMTLLALLNVLDDGRVHKWFHADKRVQATQLLLHERPMRASALRTLRNTAGAPRPERSVPGQAAEPAA